MQLFISQAILRLFVISEHIFIVVKVICTAVITVLMTKTFSWLIKVFQIRSLAYLPNKIKVDIKQ